MTEVEWSDEAVRSVEEIHDHIALDKPLAAVAFAATILRAGDSLKTFPQRGRPAGGQWRELTSVRPYVVRYLYDPTRDHVMVVSVTHGARLP